MEWFYGVKELRNGAKYSISSVEGTHTLKVMNVSDRDEGEYRVVIHNSVGRDSSKGMLSIEGKRCDHYSF